MLKLNVLTWFIICDKKYFSNYAKIFFILLRDNVLKFYFIILVCIWPQRHQVSAKDMRNIYCVKSVRIRSFSGSYFPSFGLNTERYSVSLRIQSECGKIRTRKTSNTDTFHAVIFTRGEKNFLLGEVCKFAQNLSNSFNDLDLFNVLFNPFHATGLFLYLLKTLENYKSIKFLTLMVSCPKF